MTKQSSKIGQKDIEPCTTEKRQTKLKNSLSAQNIGIKLRYLWFFELKFLSLIYYTEPNTQNQKKMNTIVCLVLTFFLRFFHLIVLIVPNNVQH